VNKGVMKSKLRGLKSNDIIVDDIQVVTEEEYAQIEEQCSINFIFLENIFFPKEKNDEDEKNTL
jgi:hypothetical protein